MVSRACFRWPPSQSPSGGASPARLREFFFFFSSPLIEAPLVSTMPHRTNFAGRFDNTGPQSGCARRVPLAGKRDSQRCAMVSA